jgi:hypothetical protein
MANYNKSFNFRNGVQVDNDNFVVNANGLVGIGTTIPTEYLDVYGNARVTGLVTTSTLYVRQTAVIDTNINVGITSIRSGIITATSTSGIVTYYGDGGKLRNLPTSQWVDADVGFGYTSIYAAGNVGIATTNPEFTFQVGQNVNNGYPGVGFNSTGNIIASGIITANSFVGYGSGISLLNASNISSGTIDNAYIPVLLNSKLPTNINVSGIITATNGFSGNITGNITGNVTGNVNSSGVSTFSGGIVGDITGNVTGIASTARSLIGTPNIIVGVVTATSINAGVATVGIATIFTELDVGVGGTAFTALNSGRIGVGTVIPTSEIQVLKQNSGASVDIIGTAGEVKISIGQSIGIGNSTVVLRFGNQRSTFDIINRAPGNINNYLHSGNAGINTGNFSWIYGQNNNELMTLTYTGKLGIGITNPSTSIHAIGDGIISGSVTIGDSLTVTNSITAGQGSNQITLGSGTVNIFSNTNLNTTTGITTLNQLNVTGISSVGIGTEKPSVGLDARNQTALFSSIGVGTGRVTGGLGAAIYSDTIFKGSVGIGTTDNLSGGVEIFDNNIILQNSNVILSKTGNIGINTDFPIGAIDLRLAFLTASLRSVFYPPILTTSQKNSITPTYITAGAVIYNSSVNRLEYYNGSGWCGIATVAGA